MSSSLPFAFLDVGTPELLLIFFVILLLFGGQRLPELAKGLGKSIREFKKATAGVEEEIKRAMEDPSPAAKIQTTLPRAVEPVPVAASQESVSIQRAAADPVVPTVAVPATDSKL